MNYEIERGIGHAFVFDYASNIVGSAYKKTLVCGEVWNIYVVKNNKEVFTLSVKTKQEVVPALKELFDGAKLIS